MGLHAYVAHILFLALQVQNGIWSAFPGVECLPSAHFQQFGLPHTLLRKEIFNNTGISNPWREQATSISQDLNSQPHQYVIFEPSTAPLVHRRDLLRGCGANLTEPPFYVHNFNNPGFEHTYPISKDEFARMPLKGDYTRLKAFMRKLAGGKTGHIIVLGGSPTDGADCKQHLPDGTEWQDTDCSWPARVAFWLHTTFPQSKIVLENLARHGASSCVHLSKIVLTMAAQGRSSADLLMLDTVQNDWMESGNDDCFENLIRLAHAVAPQIAIQILLAGNKVASNANSTATHRKIVEYYSLPYVDYVPFVLKDDLRYWGNTGAHPFWRNHQIMADLISNSWGKVLKSSCDGGGVPWQRHGADVYAKKPLIESTSELATKICFKTASHYASDEKTSESPQILTGDWKLFEDRPGKPGWIASKLGAQMRFPVKFGDPPQLTLSYLKSYTSFGDARLVLRNSSSASSLILNGTWDYHVSQTFAVWLGPKELPIMRPNATLDLDFELITTSANHSKFKILEVLTC